MKLIVRRANNKNSFKIDRFGKWSIIIAVVSLISAGVLVHTRIDQSQPSSAISESIENYIIPRMINPRYEQYVEDVVRGEGAKWNIVPSKYIAVSDGVDSKSFGINNNVGDSINNLPSKFSLIEEGYGTPIKNQGPDGICWAYAITTAAESYLLKNNNIVVEFSPKQLDYLFASGTPHGNFISNYGVDAHELGGSYNFIDAAYGFNNGLMPVDEAGFFGELQSNDISLLGHYSSWRDYMDDTLIKGVVGQNVSSYTKPMSYGKVTNKESDYIITDFAAYPYNRINPETIKQSIMEKGAVYVETVAPFAGTSLGSCYDTSTRTIVDRGYTICGNEGHAMSVIGWDDNFEYTDPSDGTTKKGVFILQNSWGESDLFQKHGATYESLVQEGVIDPSGLTNVEIQAIKNKINNYDAYETFYLAYSTSELTYTIFGIMEKIEPNIYDDFLEVTTSDYYQGNSFGDTTEEVILTYDIGSETKSIDMISLSFMYIFLNNSSLQGEVYLDSGNGYISLGNIQLANGPLAIQRTLKLNTPISVSGIIKFKIKITINGMPLDLDGLKDDILLTAYLENNSSAPDIPDEPDVPDTPDTPDIPDTPDTPDIPDTPDTPDTPDEPDTPDQPDVPDAPDDPTPSDPDEPTPKPTPSDDDIDVPSTSAPDTGDNQQFSLSSSETGIYLLPSMVLIAFSVIIMINAFKNHVQFEKR